jgi:hypothetical protein
VPPRNDQPTRAEGDRESSALRRVVKSKTAWFITTVMAAAIGWLVVEGLSGVKTELTREDPVLINYSSDPVLFEKGQPDWTGYSYVIPRSPKRLGSPPRGECRARRTWAYDLNGADAAFTKLRVTAEGRAAGTVLIDSIKVRVLERLKPLRGAHALCPVGGASANLHGVAIDLDQSPPTFQYADHGTEPRNFAFTLKKGEVETFDSEASAEKCYCTWIAKFEFVADGKRQSVRIGDERRPFRTTGIANTRPVVWNGRHWERFQR